MVVRKPHGAVEDECIDREKQSAATSIPRPELFGPNYCPYIFIGVSVEERVLVLIIDWIKRDGDEIIIKIVLLRSYLNNM